MTVTTVTLSPLAGAGWQFFDNNGIPLAGGLLYTYAAGTSTPLATYTTFSGNISNSNPIVLDSAGRVPSEIWLTFGAGYKFVLKNSSGLQIWSYDNIPTNLPPPFANDASGIAYEQGYTVTAGSFVVGNSYLITSLGTTNFTSIGAASNTVGTYFTATGVGTGTGTAQLSRTVQAKLQEIVSIEDFGAISDGTTDNSAAINAALDYVGLNGGGSVYVPTGVFGFSHIFIKYSNVTLYGEGAASSLKQVGSPPANYSSAPTGSIFTNPNAAIIIAPPNFVWGDSQDPNTSTVGTVSSVVLKDFKLTGWWSSAPPPYNGYNTNITGQPLNDRSGGIFALCTAEIYYQNLTISQMGAENSYSWNAYISNCWIVNGGETGSLGEYGNVVNCRVQNSYCENGVSARYIIGNEIFSMYGAGILIGGSSIYGGAIVSNNYVYNCGGPCITASDDGATSVVKNNFIFENNVFVGNTTQTNNTVVTISYAAAGSTYQINNNFITGINGSNVGTGLYFVSCKGIAYVNNNIITGTIGTNSTNGISTNSTTGFLIYLQGNNISGVNNAVDTTIPATLLAKSSNFIGGTVVNGTNTLQAPTIDNLIVNENIVYTTTSDVVLSPTTTYSPIANQGIKQCQFTGSGLTINPPSGYQPGQVFILEIYNASGGTQTVTMSAGTAPAAYKGSLTSGVSLNNGQRVIVQMVYITNTWLQTSIATL